MSAISHVLRLQHKFTHASMPSTWPTGVNWPAESPPRRVTSYEMTLGLQETPSPIEIFCGRTMQIKILSILISYSGELDCVHASMIHRPKHQPYPLVQTSGPLSSPCIIVLPLKGHNDFSNAKQKEVLGAFSFLFSTTIAVIFMWPSPLFPTG